MSDFNYKTLIIAPHCDDEVLGCGGIINNRLNDRVFVYYLGVEDFHIVSRSERLQEVAKVAGFLKFEYQVGNNIVNNYDKKNLISEITELINRLKPDEVFIPNPSYNQDHQEVYQASLVALRPHDKNFFVKNVFIYEIGQYLLWAANQFTPNYFESIDIEKKIAAYKLHASQVRDMRPPELLKHFAAINGLASGNDYAEGFMVLRMVR
jgi:LmbE family N-acetylglucosaminyl deacetylase